MPHPGSDGELTAEVVVKKIFRDDNSVGSVELIHGAGLLALIHLQHKVKDWKTIQLQSPWSRRARASDWSSREATQQQHLMPHTSFAGSPSWKVKVNQKWKHLFWLQEWKVRVHFSWRKGKWNLSLMHLFSRYWFEKSFASFFRGRVRKWKWRFFVGMESECLTLVLGMESESDV